MLEAAIERLQIGIALSLSTEYTVRFEPQSPGDALLLANCILSYATVMPPIGSRAKVYEATHRELIVEEAMRLSQLKEVAEPFSYLYAGVTLLLAIRTKNSFSELATQLCDRATELSLDIPNTYDLCGSADAVQCIQAIGNFSVRYKRQIVDRSTQRS